MQTHTATPVSTATYVHGEGMRWDDKRSELLWVDISAGRFLRAAPDDVDTVAVHEAGVPVGVVAPRVDGGWVMGAGRGFWAVDEDGGQRELAQVEPAGNRMNDGACDPAGRFWVGSMAEDERPGAGSLHVLEPDGTVERVLSGLTISNGLGWSPDGATAYLNDSGAAATYALTVDPVNGRLRDRRVLVAHDPATGTGDGLTMDDDGHLWVPLWGGAAVHRYDPAGRLVARVELAARQPTACCLVDGTLFVTTASKGLRDPSPDDGRLFAADVGATGPPVARWSGSGP